VTVERLGIIGSGTIGCGLAVAASVRHAVVVWARSDASAQRAERRIAKLIGKLEVPVVGEVSVTTELTGIEDQTFLIEAVAEDTEIKSTVLDELGRRAAPDAIIATTTSSLPVEVLAAASRNPGRFVAFHVFNPVPRMELIELAFPARASQETRRRARELACSLDKTPIQVPSTEGFVVNRLLFPYLFDAVRFVTESGMGPDEVDACMTFGAGHPMGPLALLDFVGLDVAAAIGDSLGIEVPTLLQDLVADGALGRKSGRGLHEYDDAGRPGPRLEPTAVPQS
jgi:3-hydroxybutyryl-CoA dehydrogenase